MPAELSSHTGAGRLLAGRYRVLRSLGGGGMADVILAEDETLARLVAVKILRPQLAGDEQFVERFRREAQAAASLGHPNIVGIYDRGSADGFSYIVMEYVRGETLKERLRRQGRLAPEEAVVIALQVLAGLRFAHERHVVHRDVTAQNILIDGSGTVKIADFGIARVGASGLTNTGARMGTVQYVSPEQAKGEPTDERSDLYSFGVIFFEMLTGRLPFTGESDLAVALKHTDEPPPRLASLVAGLSPELERITLKALAKDPDQRYQTAAQLTSDLRRWHEGASWGGESAAVDERPRGEAAAAANAVRAGNTMGTSVAPGAAGSAPVAGVAVEPTRVLAVEPTQIVDAAPTRVIGPEAPAGDASTHVVPDGQTLVARAVPTRVVAPARDEAPTRVVGAASAARRAARRHRLVTLLVVTLLAALALGGYVAYRTYFSPLATVPKVVGQTEKAAVAALKKDGFSVARHDAFSDKYADGYVVRQTPASGSGLADGGKVHLWIRSGPVHVRLPNFRGRSPEQVKSFLARYDIGGHRRSGASRRVAAGLVYRQSPAPGATVARGDDALYWVSTGMPQKPVPDVLGASLGTAKADLEDAGFSVSVKTAIGFGEVPGTVVDQEPLAGATAREGTVVTIWVALL
jgi:beta-lactam-binding protein with PASTA domain